MISWLRVQCLNHLTNCPPFLIYNRNYAISVTNKEKAWTATVNNTSVSFELCNGWLLEHSIKKCMIETPFIIYTIHHITPKNMLFTQSISTVSRLYLRVKRNDCDRYVTEVIPHCPGYSWYIIIKHSPAVLQSYCCLQSLGFCPAPACKERNKSF